MTSLFIENSAIDLSCRGFNQAQILDMTGIDVGYHGSKIRNQAVGVDRLEYKAVHIAERCDDAVIQQALDSFAAGCSLSELAEMFGLGAVIGTSGYTMRAIFAIDCLSAYAGMFRLADKQRRLLQMRDGMQDAHGVDNPFKLAEYQRQAAKTREERYGAPYTLAHGSVFEEPARKKILASTDAALVRRRATMLDRYGVPVAMQASEVRRHYEETMLVRYGVRYPSQMTSSRRRASRRMRSKAFRQLLRNGQKKAMLHQYDGYSSEAHKRKHHARKVVTPADKRLALRRYKETCLRKYGYDHPSKRPSFRKKMSAWMIAHADQVAESTRLNCLARNGVDHHVMSPEARARQAARMRDPEWQRHIVEVRRERGSLAESKPEVLLRNMLVDYFGENDVRLQYRDQDRYPFACDFYIPSRDMFIELNGTWTHGGHWYDETNDVDKRALDLWRSRSDKSKSYYERAIYTWTDLDVRKCDMAAKHKLNYVVLWDGQDTLADARLWLAMGAPDGCDWKREYSWVPSRSLNLDDGWPTKIGEGPRLATAVARAAQWRTFYSRELTLWNDDDVFVRRCGRVQGWLYANRYRYVHKLPNELTDLEILRGMTVSSLVRGYTVFDNTAMRQVLDRYHPVSVYDPCAGWGERLVTCSARGISYVGADVNPAVIEGHRRIVAHYGLHGVESVVADSSVLDAEKYDADMVFTCPPYGDVEHYTDVGAENLDTSDFLEWWRQVVLHSIGRHTRVFAFQVNQAQRQAMGDIVALCGWQQVDAIDLSQRASHLNRSANGRVSKREYETVLIFERV